MKTIPAAAAAAVLAACALSGCGAVGDTESIRDATALAIDCEHDAALEALERAREGGGLSRYLADLERIVVLRDAGRTAAADDALDAYIEANGLDRAEVSGSVDDSLAELRRERREQTGREDCP